MVKLWLGSEICPRKRIYDRKYHRADLQELPVKHKRWDKFLIYKLFY